MFSIGCIQAQVCNTGFCPTGVTTQDASRQKALVVTDKSERVYNFHNETLKTLKELVEAAGLQHPHEIDASHIVRRISKNEVRLLSFLLPEMPAGLLLKDEAISPSLNLPRVFELYWNKSQASSFSPLKH
jgi:hypothetical protein